MSLNEFIDHTLLKPDAVSSQIETLCQEAVHYQFASVCVQPTWVALAAKCLAHSSVKVCTVIGFPHGANSPATKAFETRTAIAEGAQEVDMVINIGALKEGNDTLVAQDIAGVVHAAREANVITKVIIETSLLTDEEKVRACQLAVAAGADFVKTATGFAQGGATVADIRLMRQTVGSHVGVKASGGVRSAEVAQAMIDAGATCLGTSSGVAICTDTVSDAAY